MTKRFDYHGLMLLYFRRRGSRSLTRSTISEEASQYEHVYDGSRGLRTEKGLTFTNPTVYENYTPSI